MLAGLRARPRPRRAVPPLPLPPCAGAAASSWPQPWPVPPHAPPPLQPAGSLKLGSSLLCEVIPGGKKESYEDLDEVGALFGWLHALLAECGWVWLVLGGCVDTCWVDMLGRQELRGPG